MNGEIKGVVTIKDRSEITVNGVENIIGFDEGYVVISTTLGEVNVEGEELKIEDLSKERGEILIKGKVNAFYYKDKVAKKRKGRE